MSILSIESANQVLWHESVIIDVKEAWSIAINHPILAFERRFEFMNKSLGTLLFVTGSLVIIGGYLAKKLSLFKCDDSEDYKKFES